MRKELLPCPCCGFPAQYSETYFDQEDPQETLVVERTNCLLNLTAPYLLYGSEVDKEKTYRELAEQWNTRIGTI